MTLSPIKGFAVLSLLLMPVSAISAQAEQAPAINNARSAISAFSDLCVATFPDEQDFLTGMSMNSYGFKSAPKPKLPHRWTNRGASLVYADENMMVASGQPAPQCIFGAVIMRNDDHLAMVRDIESQLLIEGGNSEGRGGVNRTTWNYFDDAGNQLRMFFQTRQTSNDRLAVRLTLLRIAQSAAEPTPEAAPSSAPQAPTLQQDDRPVLESDQTITNPEEQPGRSAPDTELQLEDEVLL
ncbi:hypothetical protein ACR9YC_06905 [Parasphingorhabdus sp. DH2-15]|uniref:hypothetical protein n=1 Tax=Parasphingorhabdus sp. DH2-15 TaxID=3444112 RepID=UPI003F682601